MNAPLDPTKLINRLAKCAEAYVAMGWTVQPLYGLADGVCMCRDRTCLLPGMHPRVGATQNTTQLSSLFSRSPALNIGIATGTTSNMFVIAVDARAGGCDSLARLEDKYEKLPDTLTAKTARGDQHIVFKLPRGIKLVRCLGKEYPGIGIKGDGEFIPVEPSVLADSYSWTDWEVGESVNIAEAPKWLLTLAQGLPVLTPRSSTMPPHAADMMAASCDMKVRTFGDIAWKLQENGFQPVPIVAGTKRPAPDDWTNFVADLNNIERFRHCHTGLLTKWSPAADIDVRVPEIAERLRELARTILGAGAIRVGMEPKLAILYRTENPFSKLATPEYSYASDGPEAKKHKVEFLASGQQLVGFAIHEVTGKPYRWRTESPLELRQGSLPLITEAKAREFINAATNLLDNAPGLTRIHPELPGEKVAGESVDDTTLAELRSALAAMPSDDRDLWQRMGHALKTLVPQQGYALFTEWSQKSPKYDAADAERKWNSFHPDRTHWKAVFTEAQKARWLNPKKSIASAPVGSTSSPDADPYTYSFELPEFPPECLHGIVGDVVKLATLNTEAGVPGCAFATLALFGAAAGRNAYVEIGDAFKHLRPWGIVIGPTSTGRKGTSLDLPSQLIRQGQDIADSRSAGNLSGTGPRLSSVNGVATGEGLIYAIRDGTDLRSGTQPKWQPIEDKRLLVIDEEFASTLAKCSRKDATLSAILRKAWDGRKLDNQTRAEPVAASRPHIVMLSQITPDEFLRKTETVELMNGLINRYMLILSKRNRSVPFPEPAPAAQAKGLAQRLAGGLFFSWGGKHVYDPAAENGLKVTLSAEAKALYGRDYERLITRERPGIVGGATGRMSTQVWIIAATYAVLDESDVVKAEHMEAALGWARYGFECAALLFNVKDNKKGQMEDAIRAERVFDAIRGSGSTGITRTELSAEFSGHLSGSGLNVAIQALLGQQRISEQWEGNTGGRPAKRYFAAQH